ncbi:TonB-dependent receptor [Aurantibacter sp.]|uniref:TonB-dependent receptor n=1 Tax=Aurantibacter sp. TaxID=2807103 RepID=UPI003266A729
MQKKHWFLLFMGRILNKNRTMKLSFLLFALALFNLHANSYAQNKKISLEANDESIESVLEKIESQSKFNFFYKTEEIDVNRKVTIKVTDTSIKEILQLLFENQNVSYKVIKRQIVLKSFSIAMQTSNVVGEKLSNVQFSISGKVTDDNGQPLPGANIIEKGTTNGTQTDFDGNYTISLEGEAPVLIFSYLGFQSQEKVVYQTSVIDIQMLPDSQGLEEVVIIGYGVTSKSSQTGAIESLKGEKLLEPSSAVISEGLIGKMAGVDISSSTYSGEQPNITIRGVRSLNASNSPLVIVDGVPGSLATISPYDIKSIEVLKDASSAAVFGTRAANGVILVTTKRAPNTKYSVSYNTSIGINKPNLVNMMSGEEYAQFRRDGVRFNNGWASGEPTNDAVFFPEEIETIDSGQYNDWQDLFFRDGWVQQHNFNLGYKEAKTSFTLSGTLMNDKGYIPTNEFTKDNLNFSIDHSLSDKLDFGATLRYTRNKLEGLATPSNAELFFMNPFSNPYDDNGDLIDFPSAVEGAAYNILANTRSNVYEDFRVEKTKEYLFFLNYRPFKGLSIKPTIGIRDRNSEENRFYGSKSFERSNKVNEARKFNSTLNNNTFNVVANYHHDIDDHSFDIDGIFETVSWKSESTEAFGRNQPVEATGYNRLESSTEDVRIASNFTKWNLASLVGRVRYNYKNKYLLNASIRRDGSSRLSDGRKWSNFPGVSAAWRLSEEEFVSNDFVNNLKLRASYGSVGNTSVDPYSTLPSLSPLQYSFDEMGAYYYNPSSSLSNPNLGWEISKTIDFGLDVGLLNNRIKLTVDVYRTNTNDVILARNLPILSGYTSTTQNIAETQNEGLEVSLGFVPVQTDNVTWSFDVNYANNQQEILKLTGDTDRIINGAENSLIVGQPLNIIYDYEFDGIWQTDEVDEAAEYGEIPGMIKLKDQNDNGNISPEDDRRVLGQLMPKHILGFTTSLRYKNFDLLVNANARWGYLISSDTFGSDLSFSGSRWLPNINYWTPDNPSNQYPAANAGANLYNNQQVLNYMSGDFFRVRQITLGYDLGEAFSKFSPINRVRAYVQVNNPFFLYKAANKDVHPEAPDLQRTIPFTMLFGMNINLNL